MIGNKHSELTRARFPMHRVKTLSQSFSKKFGGTSVRSSSAESLSQFNSQRSLVGLTSESTLDETSTILTDTKCPSILWPSRRCLAPWDAKSHRHPATRDGKNSDFARVFEYQAQRIPPLSRRYSLAVPSCAKRYLAPFPWMFKTKLPIDRLIGLRHATPEWAGSLPRCCRANRLPLRCHRRRSEYEASSRVC